MRLCLNPFLLVATAVSQVSPLSLKSRCHSKLLIIASYCSWWFSSECFVEDSYQKIKMFNNSIL